MKSIIRTTDDQGRVRLPKAFANCTVFIDQVSDTEVRIRKAEVTPKEDVTFMEETRLPLSDRDRDLLLSLLENPPEPNEALKKAIAKFKTRENGVSLK